MRKTNYEEKANQFFEEVNRNQIIDQENSIRETYFLLSNPTNAKRIEAALEEFRKGKGKEKHLKN